ncbi:OB-fold domain-containing protein [Pseudolysinimonas kribbensis]|uniref:Zn-ribbon domain-containing OB-fold protein n=1 Tax=Pseudolysinimonas kribbensis TaxID=433641 RepID=UPI0031E10173
MGERIGISPAAVYAEGLVGGRLRYQRCTRCGHAVFFPRVVCPHCGDARLEWEDSAGSGVVYSTTTTRSRSGDYNVALIDLDEGFRMMCTVRDAGDGQVRIGDRVRAIVPPGTTAETLEFSRIAES